MNWKHEVDLRDIYEQDGCRSYEELGEDVAKELEPLKTKMPMESHMIEELQDIFNGQMSSMVSDDEFNSAMNALYDFADVYGIWVKTR